MSTSINYGVIIVSMAINFLSCSLQLKFPMSCVLNASIAVWFKYLVSQSKVLSRYRSSIRNMKTLTVAIIFCSAFLYVSALRRENQKEMTRALLVECKTTEGGTDEDFVNLTNGEEPPTAAGVCMIACAYETVGLVSTKMIMKEQ